MAEALLGIAFEKLTTLIQNEFATLSGIREKTEKLSNTLDLIKAVIEDAEEKQITNRSVKVWLQQLKDAVYVLDDILDECSIKSHRLKGLSSFKPMNIMFRHEVGSRLKEIASRFDQIAEGKNKFLLQEGVRERPNEVAEWRQTSSVIDQSKVYGRDADKEKIVEFLLSPQRCSDFLSVYPIVGLGGLGKTTLSQLVYNDERVSSHFNLKIWVCVSENFSIKRILCSIIESIAREKFDAFHLDVVERKVQELLQSKRYFLVLDDVWKRTQQMEFGLSNEKWNKLKNVLSCGSKGASVLVSTRDNDVAAIMGTCKAHHLCPLSEDNCWLLFKQYAFGFDQEERPELVAIGKEIIKKCGGSPLAAQALGGVMRSKREKNEWLEVKESKLWTLPDENSIMSALRLSYIHLTPTLKQCFAFCAIFPKDTKISKEEMIYLWMANGFISSRGNMEVEDVGNIIWNELARKSFFQDIETDNFSGDISFKMHDLVHDLAQSAVGQECLVLENSNMNDLSRNTHHIGFGSERLNPFNKGAFEKVESLRTLYQLDYAEEINFVRFPKNCSLRVLRTMSPDLLSISNLIHLRYLELYGSLSEMKTLPESICSLHALEILKLSHLYQLVSLPKRMNRLQNLRHLVISYCGSLSCMFPYIRKLSCLRTLSVYIVRSETGHSLAELHDLKLTGSLRIEGLENVGSLCEAQKANLMEKKDLTEIWLLWGKSGETNFDAKQVLEALQPHSNLKTLRIFRYEGLQFPSWIGILSNLVAIRLAECKNCVQLPLLGKLPSLRELEILKFDCLQYIDDDEAYNDVEVRAFTSLEYLRLEELPNLERLLKVERGEMFPSLSKVSIESCPKLGLPCLPSVKRFILCECDNNGLLRFMSSFNGLTSLLLLGGKDLTSFPDGTMRNLIYLKNLEIFNFPILKELPHDLFYLNALEQVKISMCGELESLPEQVWKGLQSLKTLKIDNCEGLRSLPEGIRHLTSLQELKIHHCPALEERCREGTGEDWDKISHIQTICLTHY